MTFDYLLHLQEGTSKANKLMCRYCGSETLALANMGICSNCESFISSSRQDISNSESELVAKLDLINQNIRKLDYPGAIKVYNDILTSTKEVGFVYAQALVYIKYSNLESSLISYDGKGFMEENVTHRNLSAKNAAIAKSLFTKLIYQSKDEESGIIFYHTFLSFIKLDDVIGARTALETLKRSSASDYLKEYAQIMFYASSKEYDKTIKIANEFIAANKFTTNAFFYIAYALFRKRKYKESLAIASQIQPYISSTNVGALIFDIENIKAISK